MTGTAVRPEFTSEVELVLLLSTPRLRDDEVERLRKLAGLPLDWNQVFGMLLMHRTGGVAWRNIVDRNLYEEKIIRPAFALRSLEMLFKGQRLAVKEHVARNAVLTAELDRRGIPCAVLKGAAVAQMAYHAEGMRSFTDNDFLFRREQLTEVGALLRELGYVQGWWDPRTGVVQPASRAEVLLHAATSHETYPYCKSTPEALAIGEHSIDVHFSVDLLTTNRRDDVVDELLGRRHEIVMNDGTRLWTLDPADMFVFLCIHFQREACNRREALLLKDLVLYKVVDLVALIENAERPVDLSAVVERARQLGLTREVYFSLVYLDALFPHRIPDGVAESLRPESTDYLHEVTHNGAPIHRWQRSIASRFFDALRVRELPEA